MYTILIVDDEDVERDGIKFLINKYKLELKVLEAGNGLKALECLQSCHVNILFTDIKMPFMDGLDLTQHARLMNPDMKIIIFSAYGEFDYAKKAIHNNICNYILKPIDPEEFLNVMNHTIKACFDEEEGLKKQINIQGVYQKGLIYEREILLTRLLYSEEIDNHFLQLMNDAGINFDGKSTVMLCINFKDKFFDLIGDEFSNILKNILNVEYMYVNLNEYQSVIILTGLDTQYDKNRLLEIGNRLKDMLTSNYNIRVCLVFSKEVRNVHDFYKEYKSIEFTLNSSFFFEYSVIFFAADVFSSEKCSTEIVDIIISDIHTAIDSYDSDYAIRSTKQLFSIFESHKSLSSVYIKYICAEVTKKILSKIRDKRTVDFKSNVEMIFAENSIAKLKSNLISLISEIVQDGHVGKRVITMIMEIIEQEYMEDIGLEHIAQKIYLTPSYLSYLFKREMGQSLIKYITLFRLNKARELLQDTNMRIVNICENVGYSKLSYFCAIFKNNYGVTPAKFRERKEINEYDSILQKRK